MGPPAAFNVNSVNPAAGTIVGGAANLTNNSAFAVSNVKRIWGAESAEEEKTLEVAAEPG